VSEEKAKKRVPVKRWIVLALIRGVWSDLDIKAHQPGRRTASRADRSCNCWLSHHEHHPGDLDRGCGFGIDGVWRLALPQGWQTGAYRIL